jgi:hypothetical protein
MKAIGVLIVLVLVVLGGVYLLGGFGSMSPEEQAANLQAAVKPGMTWKEVAEVHEPRRFAAYNFNAMGGHGPEVKYDPDAIEKGVQNGGFQQGFAFFYRFTNAHAYEVSFDPQGTCVDIEKMMTTSDLIQGKLFKQ